jgi:hypothetical protein
MSSLPFYESTITMMGKNCKKKPEAAGKFFGCGAGMRL